MPSEVVFRHLPMRIALRQNVVVRSAAGCETGLWDRVARQGRQTAARNGGKEPNERRQWVNECKKGGNLRRKR